MSSNYWYSMMTDVCDKIATLNRNFITLDEKEARYFWRAIYLHERINMAYGRALVREDGGR